MNIELATSACKLDAIWFTFAGVHARTGAFAGGKVGTAVPDEYLRIFFMLLMFVLGARTLRAANKLKPQHPRAV
jgi:uncharacterized membrane protein YfcA